MFDDSTTTAVLTPDRDDKGRFLPGNTAGKGHGRPPKVREAEVLEAINRSMPPARIEKLLNEMIDIASETRSWRGIESALSFAAAYQIGKPIQRIAQDNSGIAELAAELGIDLDE